MLLPAQFMIKRRDMRIFGLGSLHGAAFTRPSNIMNDIARKGDVDMEARHKISERIVKDSTYKREDDVQNLRYVVDKRSKDNLVAGIENMAR